VIIRDAIALATIVVDRIQVQPMLVNVLSNAAQTVRDLPPENGIIRIVAETTDWALMRLKGRGHGLPFSKRGVWKSPPAVRAEQGTERG